MYLPKLFKSEDYLLLKEIIIENSFSSLITFNGRIRSTKAMFLLCENNSNKFHLETHLSRANPISKSIEKDDEVLCDFLGAHTYISSSWYDHINVSTWNYEAVQVYGGVTFMSDDELYQHLSTLTQKYEASQKCPLTVEKMGQAYIEKEMKGALGIKIMPTEVAIKQKLSQNRDDNDYNNIIQNLEQSDGIMNQIIAHKMKALRKP
ncbi:MAG: FMN-binding negative transcriptional regulator [Saprospiraceae bacterium]